jgi:hypothetical protein
MKEEATCALFDSKSMIRMNASTEGKKCFHCKKAIVIALTAMFGCGAFSCYNSLLRTEREDITTTNVQSLVPPLISDSTKILMLSSSLFRAPDASEEIRKGTRITRRRLRIPYSKKGPPYKMKGSVKSGPKRKKYSYLDVRDSHEYEYGPISYNSFGYSSDKQPPLSIETDAENSNLEQVDDHYTDDIGPTFMGSDDANTVHDKGSDDRYFGNENQILPNDIQVDDHYTDDMGPNQSNVANEKGTDDRYIGKKDQSVPHDVQKVEENVDPNVNGQAPSIPRPTKYPASGSSKVSVNNAPSNSSSLKPSQLPKGTAPKNIPSKPKPNLRTPTKSGHSPSNNKPNGSYSPSSNNINATLTSSSPSKTNTNRTNNATLTSSSPSKTNTNRTNTTSSPTRAQSPSMPTKAKPVIDYPFAQTLSPSSPTALPTSALPAPTMAPTMIKLTSPTNGTNISSNNNNENITEVTMGNITSTNNDSSSLQTPETVSLKNEENQSSDGSSKKALYIAFASYGAGLIFAVGLIGFSIYKHQQMQLNTDEEI